MALLNLKKGEREKIPLLIALIALNIITLNALIALISFPEKWTSSGDRLKYFVEVFCFSFMYVSTIFLLGTEVYLNSFFKIKYSRYLE